MNKTIMLTIAFCTTSVLTANGGPVAWNETGNHGGIVPRAQTEIRLKSEKLRIELEDDGSHYKVEAIYALENKGPAKTLLYGVPLDWAVAPSQVSSAAASDSRISPHAKKLASGVMIELNDRLNPCQIDEASVREEIKPERGESREAAYLSGWCLANLRIASGPEIILRLSYRGEMEYEDWESGSSPFTNFAKRRLIYKLFPAATWRGPADQVSITIATGRFGDQLVVSSPAGFTKQGAERVWRGEKVDLKSLDRIVAELDVSPQLNFKEIAAWNRIPQVGYYRGGEVPVYVSFSANASSELKPESGRYKPARSLDGDPATAWCAATPAAGAWIEIDLKIPDKLADMHVCEFHAIALLPGLAKSDTLFLDNARPTKVGVELCGQPATRIQVELQYARGAQGLMVEKIIPDHASSLTRGIEAWSEKMKSAKPGDRGKSPLCLRVTLLDSIPGKKFPDLCLSEVIPVFNCG